MAATRQPGSSTPEGRSGIKPIRLKDRRRRQKNKHSQRKISHCQRKIKAAAE
jgi:hypothetical protein